MFGSLEIIFQTETPVLGNVTQLIKTEFRHRVIQDRAEVFPSQPWHECLTKVWQEQQPCFINPSGVCKPLPRVEFSTFICPSNSWILLKPVITKYEPLPQNIKPSQKYQSLAQNIYPLHGIQTPLTKYKPPAQNTSFLHKIQTFWTKCKPLPKAWTPCT